VEALDSLGAFFMRNNFALCDVQGVPDTSEPAKKPAGIEQALGGTMAL
jgi:hypothetical protein